MQKSYGIITGSDYDRLQKFYSLWIFIDPLQSLEGQIVEGCLLEKGRHGARGQSVLLSEDPRASKIGYAKVYLPKGNMQATDGDPLNILGVLFQNRGVPGKKHF